MKRFLLSLFAVAILFSACENKTAKNTDSQEAGITADVDEIVVIDLKDFEDKAGDVVGKPVVLTGTIDHVCKHGGQKMFIVSEDAENRVKIVTGEDMPAFNTELEGESLEVVGIVEELRIDEEYLREWEEELKDNSGHENENDAMHMGEKKGEPHAGDGDHHEEEESSEMKQINNLRQQLTDSGKEYLSFYSVVCVEYEVVTEEEPEGV